MQLLEGPINLLKSSWALFKTNWKILAAIVIAPSILLYVGQLLALPKNPALSIIAAVLSIAGGVVMIAMQPAAVNAIQRLSTGSATHLPFFEQYKIGFRYFWSIILLVILQGLIFLGSGILFIIPAVIVAVYTGMYVFARVLDDKKGFSALTENYSLVKGRWWGVLGRFLFFGLVYIAGGLIIAGLTFLINLIFGFASNSTGAIVISLILNLILSAILGPLALMYMYKLYISLKATRLTDVSTVAFKRWLVAFLVIGIVVIIAGFIVASSSSHLIP